MRARAFQCENGSIAYYVLRKDNEAGYKKIENRIVEMLEKAWFDGEKDKRVKTLDDLLTLCDCMHMVEVADDEHGHCPCEGNPMKLTCDCKSAKGYGICSHILTINHIVQKFNVRGALRQIGKSTAKQSGGNKKPVPALQREATREPDSSDEEEERLRIQGDEGR